MKKTVKAWVVYQRGFFSVREIYESRNEARKIAQDQRSWYKTALPSSIPRFSVRPITIAYDEEPK